METYDGGSYSEVWTKKDDDTFVGVGLALGAKGDTVFHEKMQIQWLENHLVYIAIPGDNNPTLFTLKSSDEGQFLFRADQIGKQEGLQGAHVVSDDDARLLKVGYSF